MELIDRAATKNKIREILEQNENVATTLINMCLAVDFAPTVDAVPVVRCRYCRNDCGIVGKSFGLDGYCSMGRKKMEGGE